MAAERHVVRAVPVAAGGRLAAVQAVPIFALRHWHCLHDSVTMNFCELHIDFSIIEDNLAEETYDEERGRCVVVAVPGGNHVGVEVDQALPPGKQ